MSEFILWPTSENGATQHLTFRRYNPCNLITSNAIATFTHGDQVFARVCAICPYVSTCSLPRVASATCATCHSLRKREVEWDMLDPSSTLLHARANDSAVWAAHRNFSFGIVTPKAGVSTGSADERPTSCKTHCAVNERDFMV